MKRITHTHTFAALCLTGVCALGAPAQAQTEFVDLTFEVGDWTFLPAADATTGRAEAFLAVFNRDDLRGDNIAVVLYTRDEQNAWERAAWTSDDPAVAVASGVKSTEPTSDTRTIGDLLDRAGIILGPDESPDSLGTATAESFGKGVLEADPYHPIIESGLAGNELVSFLVETGYAAALVDLDISDLGFEKQELTVDEMLNAMTKGVELRLDDPTSSVSDVHERISVEIELEVELEEVDDRRGSWCFPGTSYTSAVETSRSCGGWTLVSSPTGWRRGTGGRIWDFVYERQVTVTEEREVHKTCFDCRMWLFDQTRTGTATQRATVGVPTGHDQTTPPDAPGGPTTTVTGALYPCEESGSFSWTDWTPSVPSC